VTAVDLAGPGRERRQQGAFAVGEPDRIYVPVGRVDLPGVQVEATAAEREAAGVVQVAALQRAQSGEQLVDVEGLAQVVLRPGVEARRAVGGLGDRREHEHRRRHAAGAESGQQVEALDDGQASVEQQHVEGLRQAQVQSSMAVGGGLHGVPAVGEQFGEHRA